MKPIANELWQATQTLDHAVEYLQNDAGERDIYWSVELNEACQLLQHKADKLRVRAIKAGNK